MTEPLPITLNDGPGKFTLMQPAKPIGEPDDDTRELLDRMAVTMYANSGIGLAAPQVGKLLQAFVVDVHDGRCLREFIDPQIIGKSESMIESNEGCLSIPDVIVSVQRHESVIIRALDRYGETFTYEAEGLEAVAIQHENDHLYGILMMDRALAQSTGKKRRYKKKTR